MLYIQTPYYSLLCTALYANSLVFLIIYCFICKMASGRTPTPWATAAQLLAWVTPRSRVKQVSLDTFYPSRDPSAGWRCHSAAGTFPPVVPANTRISARLERVLGHVSPVDMGCLCYEYTRDWLLHTFSRDFKRGSRP